MNKKIWAAIIVVIIALGGVTAYFVAQDSSKHNSNTPKVTRQSSQSKSTSSSSGLSSSNSISKKSKKQVTKSSNVNMTPETAVKASQNLLREVNKAPNGKDSDKERLSKLSKSENSYDEVLTKSARDNIRLVGFMKTDKRGGVLTAQGLIQVISAIKKDGNKSLTATKMKDYNSVVYFDKANKTAVVPVDLYTTAPTNLSLEFVYNNGKWEFSPYSLISEISIRQADQNQLHGTAEGQAASSSSSNKNSHNKSNNTTKKSNADTHK